MSYLVSQAQTCLKDTKAHRDNCVSNQVNCLI